MNPLTNVRNTQKLNERELDLGLTGSRSSWHNEFKDSAWIFIGGLPYDLSEGDIITVFSQYGEIVHINLVRDKSTGKSKGFCFLCYEDQRSTILAVDNFNSIKLLNRTLRVNHVADYKMPKEHEEDDEETLALRETGCAPKIQSSSEEEESEVEEVRKKSKKEKKKKKKKEKKKKKKKAKSDTDSDESSESDSQDRRHMKSPEGQGQRRVKDERPDLDYVKQERKRRHDSDDESRDRYASKREPVRDQNIKIKHERPDEDYPQRVKERSYRHDSSSPPRRIKIEDDRRIRDSSRDQYKERTREEPAADHPREKYRSREPERYRERDRSPLERDRYRHAERDRSPDRYVKRERSRERNSERYESRDSRDRRHRDRSRDRDYDRRDDRKMKIVVEIHK